MNKKLINSSFLFLYSVISVSSVVSSGRNDEQAQKTDPTYQPAGKKETPLNG